MLMCPEESCVKINCTNWLLRGLDIVEDIVLLFLWKFIRNDFPTGHECDPCNRPTKTFLQYSESLSGKMMFKVKLRSQNIANLGY